jgi:uncharacterized protein (DUF924 family)
MDSKHVISFWFEEIKPAQWWVKDLEFDQLVKTRFLATHQAAIRGELYPWRISPEGRLAEIIVLDQFSRNMFRDTAQAFACDMLALILAQEAISLGIDLELPTDRRSFLYLPFMHSESLVIHDQALMLYQKLGNEGNLDFEIKHRDIIEKFGRYPHRNALLGRESSQAELEFLRQPNSSF